ncbi:band 4.1-like protein 2 isoform X2 [Trichomycterus rosablanca]|uniref:band 4.1-like protein 2 isoform X2 n=1 Tax=Trichomycterus rosablanca TaxID=2290929 RepID=UPI002F35BE52
MTTEVGTEAEVKKEPEKSEVQEHQDEHDENADPQPAPADTENPENAEVKSKEPGEPTSPTSPSGQKKEKGISRLLPPWLKRQKSLSQGPKESVSSTEEEPEVKGDEESPKKKEELKRSEEEQVEQNSVCSAETQPERDGGAEQKVGEEQDRAEDGVQESGVASPLKSGKKTKMVMCHVTMLDGNQFECEVEKRAKGQYLFFKVCEHLNLLEKDYFDLSFKNNADQKCWLDPTKEIKRQIRNSQWQFAFNVKFYPPDPSQLSEDITRYLLCLQLRQDILSGRLPCSFVTLTLLGSYTLQAELGDQESSEQLLHSISDFQFAPNQTKELEEKVVELHKAHRGMTPAQADIQFLENAKKLSMYGVDLHHAKDSDGVDIMLGVCANGLLIYKDRLRINRFAWPKILKISYKRSNFYIKIRPGETEQFESTVGFKLPNHRAAKRVWKVCVEHHTFFRLTNPEQPTKSKFLTLGSRFRYSGRTQAQTRQASSLIDRPAPQFTRTASKRISRSFDAGPVVSVSDRSYAPGENGHDPALELSSDSKNPQVEEGAEPAEGTATEVTAEPVFECGNDGADSSLIKDLDKTQEDVLKHQASISELKRSFMEAAPEPQPSQWEKRLTGSGTAGLRPQVQGISPAQPESALSESSDVSKSEHTSALNGQPDVTNVIEVVNETVVIEEVIQVSGKNADVTPATEPVLEKAPQATEEEEEVEKSASSESESEEEAEYHAQISTSDSAHHIKEEPEEVEEQEVEITEQAPPTEAEAKSESVVEDQETDPEPTSEEHELPVQDEASVVADEAPNGHAPEEAPPTLSAVAEEQQDPHVINGDSPHVDADRVPQVICCSEPPVVKTEMVTISDTFAAQKTEITTMEVPIVHTETKTITYEAAQLEDNGDGEPGVLMTAQTITSESLCTTTTTHITKTLKGGLSETRIEKRIVITGDSDIDHDQALAQAIKEAKEQHPDMSVTRVVVHKETELAEEDE